MGIYQAEGIANCACTKVVGHDIDGIIIKCKHVIFSLNKAVDIPIKNIIAIK